ncbi:Rad4-domain-containing protein [Polyplosphaeria fusca]|uniref:Rad4-domain-containing protein n=1 Tax=Polyplosphaeria fusca TaxID=682080 RepID=A0A9P4QXP1_9PLEO|nr:Rad4-domain-containing protein [Polyplosphaeria fusca]
MPPFVFGSGKRLRSESPPASAPSKRTRIPASQTRQSVFQTLDAAPSFSRTLSETKRLLEEEEDSELSEPESSDDGDEFEDVPIHGVRGDHNRPHSGDEDEWEDALARDNDNERMPHISGDLELTLSINAMSSALSTQATSRKGPSKILRQIRSATHCMHVQYLMYHNLTRNAWIQDPRVQRILVDGMSTVSVWRELDKYWRDSGIQDGPSRVISQPVSKDKYDTKGNGKGPADSSGVKLYTNGAVPTNVNKGKKTGKANAQQSDRNQRDWGATSDRLEPNTPNLSAGDPLLRFLKYLSAYWKKKFNITTPSLRKRGYLSPAALQAELSGWQENPHLADAFGERIEDLEAFRQIARKCEGSRDVGEQLFTALLRGLGFEARLVASLQPVGFAFTQHEEGKQKNLDQIRSEASKLPGSAQSQRASGSFVNSRQESRRTGTQHSPIDLDENTTVLGSLISLSSSSDVEDQPKKTGRKPRKKIDDFPNPTYWTEVISPLTHTPISVACFLPRPIVATSSQSDAMTQFYSHSTVAIRMRQIFAYVIAFSSDGTAKDVTTRYLPKRQWPGKTKGLRMGIEKIPVYDKHGKVKKQEEFDWFKAVMRPYARRLEDRQPWDEVEDEGDLVPAEPPKPKRMDEEGGKETLQGYKNSTDYVLERHLLREEALIPGAQVVRHFNYGKGDKEEKIPVYWRKDVVTCKSAESWHKAGRSIKKGEQPLKRVPMRAVTTVRKREIEEREREDGEKAKQGLFSKAQTDWIIPDPIEDGKIPTNAFGNMDVFVPTMVPKGAVHIPLKGTAKLCRKLNINFAEACTGFEFGNKRAVPVMTGVVVAVEHEDLVIDAWETAEAEKQQKEQEKKEQRSLGLWRKFFVGLRLVERMNKEYGEESELPQRNTLQATEPKKSEWETFQTHQDFEGGFLREEPGQSAGGFFRDGEQGQYASAHDDTAGGFLIDTQEDQVRHNQPDTAYQNPVSLHSALRNTDKDDDSDEAEVVSPDKKDDSDEVEMVSPPKSRPNTRTRGKPKASRGRPSKRANPPRRKPHLDSSDDESPLSPALSSASDSGDEDDEDTAAPKSKRKTRSTMSSKSTPKRKAAQKSEAGIKSHFFAHGSDEETDLSPQKKGAGRGKGGRQSGGGSGEGSGRGSAGDPTTSCG